MLKNYAADLLQMERYMYQKQRMDIHFLDNCSYIYFPLKEHMFTYSYNLFLKLLNHYVTKYYTKFTKEICAFFPNNAVKNCSY